MSDEELAAIRERSVHALTRGHVDTTKFAGMVASLEDVPRLIYEVEQMQAVRNTNEMLKGTIKQLRTAPSFDDLMRVLFAADGFLDCEECAVWAAVQAAFPEQFEAWRAKTQEGGQA